MQAQIEAEIAAEKIIVYSKSYCPFAGQTKNTLSSAGVQFKCVELDQVANGSQIQQTLQTISGQSTVPNIFIGGQHIGGNSDLQSAKTNGSLASKLTAAGVSHNF